MQDDRPQWAKELIDRIDAQGAKIDALEHKIDAQVADQEKFRFMMEIYQKTSDRVSAASERVANLAFTVVTASAAVFILGPAVKAIVEYLTT